MVQSPSWEANWFAASQEIPRISRNTNVHYRTHNCPPPVCILGQPNPVHIPTSNLLEIRPNIIHPSTPRSPQVDLNTFVWEGVSWFHQTLTGTNKRVRTPDLVILEIEVRTSTKVVVPRAQRRPESLQSNRKMSRTVRCAGPPSSSSTVSLASDLSPMRQITTGVAGSVAVSHLPLSLKHRAYSQISSTTSKLSWVARRSDAVPPFCFTNFKLYKVTLVFMWAARTSEWTSHHVKFITLGFHKTSPENSFIKPLKTKRRRLYLKTQSVPRCKHFSSRL